MFWGCQCDCRQYRVQGIWELRSCGDHAGGVLEATLILLDPGSASSISEILLVLFSCVKTAYDPGNSDAVWSSIIWVQNAYDHVSNELEISNVSILFLFCMNVFALTCTQDSQPMKPPNGFTKTCILIPLPRVPWLDLPNSPYNVLV